ncbi:GNAT family N-acetyltransferase [Paenibacillus allorhizosphaerae]|uniref:N-acetyltransferase domain-containing protein n=1 Tax=Paenibacillus allorhizosphaerae TaxID=2849866 RepID=A0ABN7TDC4_9BACL|nr:GNAT family N-acetyltransferase [Paenibacillus allorhizosphaerae]CAG7624712.1 hypothetical protein PAECIP111802_01092 [Paenibacillus allorhizosphaerae]
MQRRRVHLLRLYIREYEAQDFEQVLVISRTLYAQQHGSFSLVDQINGKRMIAKYVIVVEPSGIICGYGLLAEQFPPAVKLRLELVLRGESNRQELLHELYSRMESVMMRVAPYAVETRLFPGNQDEILFFKSKGFAENHRMVKRKLYVQQARLRDYVNAERELGQKGIFIKTFAEEQACEPECMELMKRIVIETNPDFPNELPPRQRQPNSNTSWLTRPDLIPEAFFIAAYQGKYIGYSYLLEGPNQALIQGNTAISKHFRNLGIATALKMKGIAYAKKHGVELIYTANRSTNGAMARVNEKLGWKMYESEIRMEKIFNVEWG